jgi:hypothetical protein
MFIVYFAIVGILATLYFGPRPVRYRNVVNLDILQHLENVPNGSSVLILSTNIYASFPLNGFYRGQLITWQNWFVM